MLCDCFLPMSYHDDDLSEALSLLEHVFVCDGYTDIRLLVSLISI